MRSQTFGDIAWHDDVDPSEKDLLALQAKYGFHELDVEDCLSEHERPKVEEYETYLFIVFHIPYLSRQTKRILKEEVNIFLGQNFLVTIHHGNIASLDALWGDMERSSALREEYLHAGTGFFLYELMHRFFDGVFPLVENITRQLRTMEDRLFEWEDSVDLLRELLTLKRNIITTRSILLPQRTLIATLEHKNRKFVSEELALYFDDILDAIERQWSLLETAKELSDALQGTHESWLSHRTNAVVRVLTIFTATMLPLTFITGLYGMNVTIPFQNHPLTFAAIVLTMVLILSTMLLYFIKKRWL